jgi:flagellar assembly protein FliH
MIAKERLTAYERWELHDFSRARSSHANTPAAASAQPAEVVTLPTAADIERIHNQAHKDGYAAGYDEGVARVRMEAMHVNSLIENLDTALATLDQTVAKEVLALALELARQVVRQAVAVKPELVLTVVREALAQLPHHHAAVFLHPEDASLVRMSLGDQLTHAGHRIFEDDSVSRGGCRVEAAGTQIDATLETRWRRVVESLGVKASWIERPER